MELLDLIETQMVANRLPLVGVTLAAVPHANTPLVLTLHWHGFVEIRLAETADANPVAYQSVPSSALQVNKRWDHFDDIDLETMETAWELGAWDLQRIEARPPLRMGASVEVIPKPLPQPHRAHPIIASRRFRGTASIGTKNVRAARSKTAASVEACACSLCVDSSLQRLHSRIRTHLSTSPIRP